ncbi:MAG: type II toxin-antitoxin system CcdA family antitoxin [Rhizobiaceae bacterium]|nr:type II toxin-antitoxin system CcdA family antitoxin [Rhizobiaceae bacterium]
MTKNFTLKKPTNLSLDSSLLEDARKLDINLSKAAEAGLKEAVRKSKSEQWKKENAAALKGANDWVKTNGLPLEKYRRF